MAAGRYRYVMMGAGAAGCVLANRLSADPACQVALPEAGGRTAGGRSVYRRLSADCS